MKELADFVHSEAYVRASECKVLKSTYHAAIVGSILSTKRLSIGQTELFRGR
jgi:hypothetical protein